MEAQARTSRVVIALIIIGISLMFYQVRRPFCGVGEEGYVPPSQLHRALTMDSLIALIFGPTLAVFGPRWRMYRLRPGRMYPL